MTARRLPSRVERTAVSALFAQMHYEIVPMASIDRAIADLPHGAKVSVTCSPAKGIASTQEYTERLLDAGHHPTPHLAARLVEGPGHAADLARWCRSLGLAEVFVIAGDAPEPAGPYDGAAGFLRDFLAADPGTIRLGVAGYPERHALIDDSSAHLHTKQALLAEFGVAGWVSTQMCFDGEIVRRWLRRERAAGLRLPVRLGVPGVVDRRRLTEMGVRLGIGPSLRYLRKNRATVLRMVAPGGYDPTGLVDDLADDATELGIEGLHAFTFNAVAATRELQERLLGEP